MKKSSETIFWDANIAIYIIEGYPPFDTKLKELVRRVERGEVQPVMSELALAEVLVLPVREEKLEVVQRYEDLFAPGSRVEVIPVSRGVLRESARLRAMHRSLRLPDAIHAATSLLIGCDTFLSHDGRFQGVPGLGVLDPADLPGVSPRLA